MKRLILSLAAVILMTGCAAKSIPPETAGEISYAPESGYTDPYESGYIPLNYTRQIGIWLPYMRFDELLRGKSEEEYRRAAADFLEDSAAQGVNTVYYHAHANGDAYYMSELFPRGDCFDGDYDPLAIFLEEAHSRGLSVHAWINPLRCQTEEQMNAVSDRYIIKQWTQQPESGLVRLVDGRWYLVPSHEEVRGLLRDCADEILSRYDIDGIHIDDYFYPTTDESFDAAEFAASGSSDLAQWRRETVSAYVKILYDTVKSHGQRLWFGISPQGNISSDIERQYADVRLWCSESGYCDYIVPQLYYGFKNECCPFASTLSEWEELAASGNISLIAGLAVYKTGKSDKWAGESGINEWIDDPEIIEKQIELVQSSFADGYALYC